MAIIVSQIKTPLESGSDQNRIFAAALKTARLHRDEVEQTYLVKSSIDARRQEQIYLVSSVGFELKGTHSLSPEHLAAREEEVVRRTRNSRAGEQVKIQHNLPTTFQTGSDRLEHPPVIVGFGPAGMFAGLALARMGYRPIILERGADVDRRVQSVRGFWDGRQLDPQTNVQFGEGGAGTFSDGKLTTRINDPRCSFVLEEMIRHGAPQEIRYQQKPHVGTDLLRDVVKNIRNEIIQLGGQVRFLTRLEDVTLSQGRVFSIRTTEGEIPVQALVLAIGHSARDTFEMLAGKQIFLEPKPFSVGVRIEQRQQVIDRGLYGRWAGHPVLPKGEYQLSWRDEQQRGVYTFCMCPGGFVVASSSEEDTVVTNGMSEHARDGENANSALVVSVDAADFGNGVLDGIAFQRQLERTAFRLGGGDYRAPAQSVSSFLDGSSPDLSHPKTQPTFSCGVREADLHSAFPEQVNRMLEQGMRRFERKLPGFADADAIITGIETRTSSPVRMTRNPDSLQALGVDGLYPCGEGAGYAGGIVSAAVDGIRVAQQIMERYQPLDPAEE